MPPPILPAIPRISREKTTIMSTMGSTQDSSTDRMGLMGSTYSGPKLVMPCSSSREQDHRPGCSSVRGAEVDQGFPAAGALGLILALDRLLLGAVPSNRGRSSTPPVVPLSWGV